LPFTCFTSNLLFSTPFFTSLTHAKDYEYIRIKGRERGSPRPLGRGMIKEVGKLRRLLVGFVEVPGLLRTFTN